MNQSVYEQPLEIDRSGYREATILGLQKIANQLRRDSIEMIYRRGSGHPGGRFPARIS
jgi:hypothetical protein